MDSSKYSAGKICMFLAFPYFAAMKEQPKRNFVEGKLQHPIRTSLQSVYRLNKTLKMKKPGLRMKELKSCIEASETSHTSLEKLARKFYLCRSFAL